MQTSRRNGAGLGPTSVRCGRIGRCRECMENTPAIIGAVRNCKECGITIRESYRDCGKGRRTAFMEYTAVAWDNPSFKSDPVGLIKRAKYFQQQIRTGKATQVKRLR